MERSIAGLYSQSSEPPSSQRGTPSVGASLKKMTQCWINENCSPEILPYEAELVDIIMNALSEQVGFFLANYRDLALSIILFCMNLLLIFGKLFFISR